MTTTDLARHSLRVALSFPEAESLARLFAGSRRFDPSMRRRIHVDATDLVRRVRASGQHSLMERFLAEYGLSTTEGVGLMCLAEALLRVPDADTIDELIRDKIEPSDWGAHLGRSSSSLVNASTWALMLTGHLLDDDASPGPVAALRGLIRRLGEPVVRVAVAQAIKTLGQQFVLGQDIFEAQRRGQSMRKSGYTYSFDMLGEAARTAADAKRYFQAYADALRALAADCGPDIRSNPGISVKLSALHPRYEYSQRQRVMAELVPSALALARLAKSGNMGLNIDAEEADRLDLSLDVIEAVLSDPSLANWDGFGVVVQAYGLRAAALIDWLDALARRLDRRIMVRLVKGAYWDSEIKHAQELGLAGFPVYTNKAHTDMSYLLCAERLLTLTDRIYPQFATHNAHSCSAILALANDRNCFEFQRLHGMGESLHQIVMASSGTRCRIYAPVGAHRDLLAYLVRRLLENGANSSFVNQIANDRISPEQIARDPFESMPVKTEAEATADAKAETVPITAVASAIRRPADLFAPERQNSRGWDLTDPLQLAQIDRELRVFREHRWSEANTSHDELLPWRINPANSADRIGRVRDASNAQIDAAFEIALNHWQQWSRQPVSMRAQALRRAGALLEANSAEFLALCYREAGKTLKDGVAELREAVDFLRYYAAEAERLQQLGQSFGKLEGRGVFVCISPWNFPLAIFCGQVAAALATGNAVIAKPAEQTPLIAARAVALLHEAGIPREVLQFLPGDGPRVGARLSSDPRIAGVVFTGSSEVAHLIDRAIAANANPNAVLIAETGGLNAMIVDSTALPEQVVRDVIASAFQSTGQRCSALRMLYVQSGIEARLLEMLAGAMDELRIGDPSKLDSDLGPVIDNEARAAIIDYCESARRNGRLIKAIELPERVKTDGWFVAPAVIRVNSIGDIPREIFGPVLHVASFEADRLDSVVDDINDRGFGLTFGLHTRIDDRVQRVTERIRVGNVYVNRNQIGAVVGSQPFGGEGMSGTGPKAGGPHYLLRFVQRPIFNSAGRPFDANPVKLAPQPHQSRLSSTIGSTQLGEALEQLLSKVGDVQSWATRADRARVIRQVLQAAGGGDSLPMFVLEAALASLGGSDSGFSATRAMPGPTGESNRLSLHSRGVALCLGPSAAQALAQAVQILLLGGQALIVCEYELPELAMFSAAGAPVRALLGKLDSPVLLLMQKIGVVAYTCDDSADSLATARTLRCVLASREGALIGLVTEVVAPFRYALERHLCIDTTAAGGNASLLAST